MPLHGSAAPDRRPRLTPAIADARRAVRTALAAAAELPPVDPHDDHGPARPAPLTPGALVLVGLSGGADSLALAAATAFEAPRGGFRAGAVVVDHGLQPGSDAVAARAAEQATALGLDPVLVRRVEVDAAGGPEGAARTARHAAFDAAVAETGAERILLAHTLDDQAETVLLGLARGSGPSSLQGMLPDTGRLLRPFLGIRRAQTRAFCADSRLEPWDDPHNEDPSYTRVRVRHAVLPALERELGPGVAEALARTAEQLREDDEALDGLALEWAQELVTQADDGSVALDVRGLASDPAALRQRIIRLVVSAEFGVSLTRTHTLAVAALITDWHGQGPVDLPGVRVVRQNGLLTFHPTT
ncbi:tRNA lysidine(34) synthetase TilS [Leifsonia shinshuensis]|uniref:tRNA lysidine(34) synthetase TilS n=1 Tax=Leifsonia shinshuensis TaxID=150026 RepID=UPI002864156B|nr:tRNA lysidine(34) synthetase TilS [Leifsonia shinshuensis]MDR6971695.1 tRNA(Ile)-lysidine synthase [Leifsonia shinshuensis]